MESIPESVVSLPPDMIKHRFEMKSILHTRSGMALVVFVVTLAISIAVEPPFLLVKSEDPFRVPQVCYMRAFAVSFILSVLFLKIPAVCREDL